MDFCLSSAFYMGIPKGTQVGIQVQGPKMGLLITPRQSLKRPHPFSRYLAPLEAKFSENIMKQLSFGPFYVGIPIGSLFRKHSVQWAGLLCICWPFLHLRCDPAPKSFLIGIPI